MARKLNLEFVESQSLESINAVFIASGIHPSMESQARRLCCQRRWFGHSSHHTAIRCSPAVVWPAIGGMEVRSAWESVHGQ